MKTDTHRYVTLAELEGRSLRAPTKNKRKYWYCTVVAVYPSAGEQVYLRVKGRAKASGGAYLVALSDCRDVCGRAYRLLPDKGVKK